MTRSDAPKAPQSVDWVARLMDEYRILQDKIDKIGGFRFTVKGWSVTLTTAALAAAGAGKIPYYVPPFLILLVLVFFLLEYEQWELTLRFGRRAVEIEDALNSVRTDRSFDFDTFRFPNIASELAQRPPEIPWFRKGKIRAKNSIHERWLIYWVQILLIMFVSGWLFTQSRQTNSPSGTIVVPIAPAVSPPRSPFRWPPTFRFGGYVEHGKPVK